MREIYHIAPKRSGHVWIGNMIKSWCPKDIYHDRENQKLDRFTCPPNSVIVIQTRDLLNWYASYLTTAKRINGGIIQRWFQITKAFYDPAIFKDHTVVRIMYDKFFQDEEYRKKICKRLGGKYNEDNLNKVPYKGGGSSFDGIKQDGNGQSMQTLYRYKQIKKSYFIQFFKKYPEIFKFYRKTMPLTEDKRLFIRTR
jgi:hypothetical protein